MKNVPSVRCLFQGVSYYSLKDIRVKLAYCMNLSSSMSFVSSCAFVDDACNASISIDARTQRSLRTPKYNLAIERNAMMGESV